MNSICKVFLFNFYILIIICLICIIILLISDSNKDKIIKFCSIIYGIIVILSLIRYKYIKKDNLTLCEFIGGIDFKSGGAGFGFGNPFSYLAKVFGLNKDEKVENEKVENEKVENEKVENEKVENERIKNERIENERIENERIEKERIEKERIENKRIIDNVDDDDDISLYLHPEIIESKQSNLSINNLSKKIIPKTSSKYLNNNNLNILPIDNFTQKFLMNNKQI